MLDVLDLNLEAKEARKNSLHRGINITTAASATGSQETIYSTLGASGSNSLPPTRTQTTMSTLLKKDLRRDAAKSIARWFYLTGTAFNAAREPEYYTMFELAARHGPGFKPPSYHEIRETLLKEELEEVEATLSIFRNEWTKVGCSIMSDGWTDRKRRSICNFLVNSPKGTVFIESLDTSNYSKNTEKVFEMLDEVVEKVGEENVLQIITDNASAYKAAGAKLMEKRLEDLEKKLPIHKTTIAKGRKITNYIYGRTLLISMLKDFTKGGELIRPALTRFATAYLTLGCLSEHNTFSNTREGKRIQGIALDSRFWTSVLTCLRAAMPLMKVLHLVDSDDSPAMPFLYLELNQAMEKIKSNFSNIEKRYKPVLNIIENRWNDQMSRPLHYAAYWLNPKVHFSANFNDTKKKLKLGLFDCVERLSKDRDESLTIMQQLDTFHHARGMFSSYGFMQLLDRKHPVDWWSSFGDDVPELQKFAIRILSLTCSASGCERNWSVFERVHSKKRNCLLQKKMNDIVYVMYNSKLLRRQAKDIERVFDEIDSDDEWLAGGDRGNNEEEYGDENAYYDEDEGDKEDEEDEELDFNVDPKDLM
ncbi:hypothetical protein LINPERHAP2_LOCUS4046 [Linum perenne]